MTMNGRFDFPFQNPDLPLAERVRDLVGRFTRDEKIDLMCQYQDEVPRLGVKKYKHGTEAAHGMAWLGEATSFPQPIGLACTWDTDLLRRVGGSIGDEARGFFARDPAVNGLTLWAPTVDMERDPRWGRTEEAYGEDPHLTGKLASALTQGIQGDHPFYLKAVASLKHFIGNNNEIDRGECSVSIDPRNKREYYLKAFELPFKEGGAMSMMTSYNAVNGVPANLNPDVNAVVKREWGMDGFVVSDAGDVLGTVKEHRYFETYKEAVAASIKAGIDSITDDHGVSKQAIRDALADGLLEESDLDVALTNAFRVRFRLGEFDPEERNPYAAIGQEAILRPEHAALSREAAARSVVLLKNDGPLLPLQASRLRNAAVVGTLGGEVYRDWYSGSLPNATTPLAGVKTKLGGDGRRPVSFSSGCNRVRLRSATTGRYVRLSGDAVSAYAATAETSEEADVVELTDWGWDNHTIVSGETGLIWTTDDRAVTATAAEIFGWFTKETFGVRYGDDGATLTLSAWNGRPVAIDVASGELRVQDGPADSAEVFFVEIVKDGMLEAISMAKESEVAIVFVGNHPLVNGKETIDRPGLSLATSQEKLVRAVYEANPNTVVVVVGSYPFALGWIAEHIPSIVYVSHAGQELGNAIADVLFGDFNPAGRLNMTWYASEDQLVDFMDYDVIRGGKTYQYFAGEPLYVFGHGLSYSRFEYADLKLDRASVAADTTISASVVVTNASDRDGEEVVQLYAGYGAARVKRPIKQLVGFRRVQLAAGQSLEVRFDVPASDFMLWDVTRDRFALESGECELMAGSSSADIRSSVSLRMDGETIPPRDPGKPISAANYDDCYGIALDTNEKADGDSITAAKPDAWIRFDDVDFGESTGEERRFETTVFAGADAVLDIRLDGPDGELIGVCALDGAEPGTWHNASCAIKPVSGRRSLCLAPKGTSRIGTFRFFFG